MAQSLVVSTSQVHCGHRPVRHDTQSSSTHLIARNTKGQIYGPDERCNTLQSTRPHRAGRVMCSSSSEQGSGHSANITAQSVQGVEAVVQASDHQHIHTANPVSVYQPASLSRVFIGVQPGRGLARQITKVGKPSGPMSLMLLLFTLAGTISAAVRQRFEAAARECSTCRGFGINRCTLCSGTGAVGWEGKWDHKEPCPMCLGKRFVDCPECGGHFHRRIFNHHHHTGLTVTELVESEQTPTSKLGD